MPHARRRLGDRGEQLAADMLLHEGFTIVERNWRCQQGEIDLVAQRESEWFCIEVRTRRGQASGSPEESLTPRKRARMEAAAEVYMGAQVAEADPTWHVGFIAVQLDSAGHLERMTLYPDVDGEPTDPYPVTRSP